MALVLDSQPPPTGPITIAVPGKPWGVEPVEALVQRGVKAVPEKYRRFSGSTEQSDHALKIFRNPSQKIVPVIDLSSWDEARTQDIVRNVKSACEEWGFFRVVNHGVSPLLMERMMSVATEFISLPVEEKIAYAAEPGIFCEGYGSKYIIKEDLIRDWRDYLFLILQPLSRRDYHYWPTTPSSFRDTMDEYSTALKSLALKLLAIISISLGLDASYIGKALLEPTQKMLINYYPPCPEPDLTAGFHKHSDIGALTLVMQEEGVVGLEVCHQGEWVPVEPIKGSFVVNVADQVEILSNGRYKSIEHRVVANREKSRISVAMFCDGAPDAMFAPAKELAEEPAYQEVKFDDHEVAFYARGARGKDIVQSYRIPAAVHAG